MIIDRIKLMLLDENYIQVNTGLPDIFLYYLLIEHDLYCVVIYDATTEFLYSKDQYQQILEKIKEKIFTNSNAAPNLISLICTVNIDRAREIDIKLAVQWFVDLQYNRLIIYENQSSEFLNLKNKIETLLHNNTTRENLNLRRISSCTLAIIILNIIIFIIMEIGTPFLVSDKLFYKAAVYWPAVIYKKEYYRIFTYMFLHSGISHLLSNMLILLILGGTLERAMGKIKFLFLYIVSGFFAGIFSLVYNMHQNNLIVSVGASGAVFGIVGAMLYVLIINKGNLEELTTGRLMIFALLTLYSGFISSGIDNAGHVGGIISGFLIAVLIYKKQAKKGDLR